MATPQAGIVLKHLRNLVGGDELRLPDRQLLERFTTHHEQAAFEALVRRHGPLVFGVCRRVLHNWHDAEDVFQATFLVLARKASSITSESVGGWLHRVAYRAALHARARSAARPQPDEHPDCPAESDPLQEVSGRELLAVLDEEVARLPEQLRGPVVLYYLQERTREEAARQLGCPLSTFRRRLEQARARLRARLARRGLALPAGLLAVGLAGAASAAVPGPLLGSTVRAALQTASGLAGAPTPATELAAGVVGTLSAARFKACALALLAVGALTLTVLGVTAAWRGEGDAFTPPAAQAAPPEPAPAAIAKPAQAKVAPEPQEQIPVEGRVLDADGKPVPGAAVTVLGQPKSTTRHFQELPRSEVLGQGKADNEGRFRLTIPGTTPARFWNVAVLARAAGHALSEQRFQPEAKLADVRIKLQRERLLSGRLLDLQGQPVTGAKVWILRVEDRGWRLREEFLDPPTQVSAWPPPAVSDARGRFTLTGLPEGITLTLLVADDRFARQTLVVNPQAQERAALEQRREQGQPLPFVEVSAGKADSALTWPLTPVRAFEGTVTFADTGKPAAGVRVLLYAGVANASLLYEDRCETRTDEQGRYRLVPKDGRFFEFFVYPPAGAPYLLQARSLQRGPGAAVKQRVEFKLPRGVLVRGKITEAVSGQPVPDASVEFVARKVDNPFYRRDAFASYPPLQQIAVSRADGSFELPVLPGPGQLLVNGPTLDYLRVETSERALTHGKPGGMRHYPNGLVPLNLKPESKEHAANITLTRGVTARGRLVGPDGKPVYSARILGPAYIPSGYTLENVRPLEVSEGTFELPGCDPNGVTTFHILAPKEQLGLVLAVRGKEAAAGPLTVTLQPCASVQMRFVDNQGKPAADTQPMLDLILTPGVSRLDFAARFGEQLLADGAWMMNVDYDGHRNPKADEQGRFTLPNLIPGATFRVLMQTPTRGIVDTGRTFTAEAGKRQQLPDIPISPPK